jgi:hypothetical protein
MITKKPKKITKKELERLEKKKNNKLWKEVRQECISRDGGCIICGSKKGDTYVNKKGKKIKVTLSAHHLIPREIKELKYDLDNLVTLCPTHHKYSLEISAHRNPLLFHHWMAFNRYDQLDKVLMKLGVIKNEE